MMVGRTDELVRHELQVVYLKSMVGEIARSPTVS
jgi:hypothetical protein